MSTPNNIANFEGKKPVIDADDAVMLLIDHQSGLFQTVGDMPMPELRARVTALAKIATLGKIPVITSASVPPGTERSADTRNPCQCATRKIRGAQG